MNPLWPQILKTISLAFEIAGAVIVIYGGLLALWRWLRLEVFGVGKEKFSASEELRRVFGQRIVLGLEFFIAGDIIRTIVTPSLVELGKLGGIVIIRTILSYSLSREIKS